MTEILAAYALIATALTGAPAAEPAEGAAWCATGRITGYVRTEHGTHTADGTPIWTDEAIAAAGYAIPLGSYVDVEGLGTYRVADRGMLGATDVDIAVWTRDEAYGITRYAGLCVRPPER